MLLLINKTGFGGEAPEILQNNFLNLGVSTESLYKYDKILISQMFGGGAKPIGGGALAPQAPMVATAL